MAQRDARTSAPAPSQANESSQQPRADEGGATPAGPEEQSTGSRRRRIEEGAYYRAQRRGFAPGSDLDDWYAAEAEEDERDGEAADRTQGEGAK